MLCVITTDLLLFIVLNECINTDVVCQRTVLKGEKIHRSKHWNESLLFFTWIVTLSTLINPFLRLYLSVPFYPSVPFYLPDPPYLRPSIHSSLRSSHSFTISPSTHLNISLNTTFNNSTKWKVRLKSEKKKPSISKTMPIVDAGWLWNCKRCNWHCLSPWPVCFCLYKWPLK